jgi:hypothetical protein
VSTLVNRIIPVTKWAEHHAWPSTSALRNLIFHADKNGFDAVVRRVAGRVLIDETAFFTWAENAAKSISTSKRGRKQVAGRDA